MIRRGFWMVVGATGGIVGYRRAAELGRSLALLARGTTPGTPAQGAPAPRTPWRHWARETIRFSRDVREGMDLYMARHPGRVGPNLGASADHDEKDDR
jgi:hypothetical protein